MRIANEQATGRADKIAARNKYKEEMAKLKFFEKYLAKNPIGMDKFK